MTRKLVAVWIATGMVLGGAAVGGVQDRVVDVTVLVVDGAGAPIEGMMVTVAGGSELQRLQTDAQGQAVFAQVVVPERYDDFIVSFTPPRVDLPGGPAAMDRYMVLAEQHAFPLFRRVPIEAGVVDYPVSVTAEDAVTISGRLRLNDASHELFSGVGVLDSPMAITSQTDGAFVLTGLAKAQDAVITIPVGGSQNRIKQIPGSSLGADFDMGDVIVPREQTLGELRLDLQQWQHLDLRMNYRDGAVTLVRDDGLLAVDLWLDGTGRARRMLDPVGAVFIPVGKYYIAPGVLGNSEVSNSLIRLVIEGKVDLDAAEVFSVVVTEGQVSEAQVNALYAEQAIFNAD